MIDWNALREVTDGDAALEAQLFDLLKRTMDEGIAALHNQLNEPTHGWKETAHRLKGAAANIHSARLREACFAAEKAVGAEARTQALSQLQHDWEELKAALPK